MSFINKHKKVLAIIAVVSFSFLTNVAAFPLKAETAAPVQQAVSVSQDQPGAIEQGSPSGYYAKKKSSPIIPIIIGLVVVGAVVAVLVLVVLKTKYDVRGTWTITHIVPWWYPLVESWDITFSGDKKSGTFIDDYYDIGVYTVDGKSTTWRYTTFGGWWAVDRWDYTGQFTDKTHISGTYSWDDWWYGDGSSSFTAIQIMAAGHAQPAKEKGAKQPRTH